MRPHEDLIFPNNPDFNSDLYSSLGTDPEFLNDLNDDHDEVIRRFRDNPLNMAYADVDELLDRLVIR